MKWMARGIDKQGNKNSGKRYGAKWYGQAPYQSKIKVASSRWVAYNGLIKSLAVVSKNINKKSRFYIKKLL